MTRLTRFAAQTKHVLKSFDLRISPSAGSTSNQDGAGRSVSSRWLRRTPVRLRTPDTLFLGASSSVCRMGLRRQLILVTHIPSHLDTMRGLRVTRALLES